MKDDIPMLCYRFLASPTLWLKIFVGWEQRKRGTSYYTRSRRVEGKVRRVYVGGGTLGEIAALEDKHERRRREEEAAYWKEQKERLKHDTAFLNELQEAAKILTTAHLLAAGYHAHKGEWRRLREQSA
jgi:hypothetical protein